MQTATQTFEIKLYKPRMFWVIIAWGVLLAGLMFAVLEGNSELVLALFLCDCALTFWMFRRAASSRGQVELTPSELRITRRPGQTEAIQRADIVACEARISDDGYAKLIMRLRSGKSTELVMKDDPTDNASAFEQLEAALNADLGRT